MKKILSDHERDQLNQLVADMENRMDAQIVLAVVKRCDSYAELPWKAFALGASIAGLVFFILNLLLLYWVSQTMLLIALLSTLSTGIVFALLTVFMPVFARLFLSPHRAELEVQQYAESLFLTRELFATRNRTGILLLISSFEKQVYLLPDKGVQLTMDEKRNIIAPMTLLLKRNMVSKAMEEGLRHLSIFLETNTHGKSDNGIENELPNEIIEEKGV